ncbi:response regulator [Pseudalkalibacillus sp. A8]|uniref:response regulator transcription factor n=1 Tax=Pseudalkalibacillus sp. A8 TaxID=3382641 RepID=UPI0038B65777
MNLKLLIVDDEPIITQGLRETVPWHELDVEIIGEAQDGEEALEIIENEAVDIILSDVKMPVMDGLELADHVNRCFPHIRIIIISGHEEFEYAKRAIGLGVRDYLLKPVDIDELMDLVAKIKHKMEQEQIHEESYMLKQLLSSLVMSNKIMEMEEIQDWIPRGCWLIGSEMKNYGDFIGSKTDKQIQALKKRWKNTLEEGLSRKGILSASTFLDENRLIICCTSEREVRPERKVYEDLLSEMEETVGIKGFFCLTAHSETPEELQSRYQDLLNKMKTHPYTDKLVFEASESDPVDTSKFQYPVWFEKKMRQMEDERSIQSSIQDLIDGLKEKYWSIETAIEVLGDVEMNLCKEFAEDLPLHFLDGVNPTVHNSYDQLKRLFTEDMKRYFDYQQSAIIGGQRWLTKKAVSYIKEHYAHDLKASEVADVINVSPNYFSQLIKQETGKHFNDYLHEVRINKAKELLKETPYRVFEIAELVGYRDYKYFVHIFKRSTSMTPTHYRNIATKENHS